MIHTSKEIILPETLQLLRKLQKDPILNDFFLVGGTSLALQIGHRLSIDLDLFSDKPFDTDKLELHLVNDFDFSTDYLASNTIKGFIGEVKVDLITHAYSLVKPLICIQGFRLASVEDIGAMKLNAIAHSGNRQKDFFDLYFMLEHINLETLLNAYAKKYPRSNPMIPLKALTWFEDIDFEIEKPMLRRKVTFEQVKNRLRIATQRPKQLFEY